MVHHGDTEKWRHCRPPVLEFEHSPQRRGVRGEDLSAVPSTSTAPASLRETSSQIIYFNTGGVEQDLGRPTSRSNSLFSVSPR